MAYSTANIITWAKGAQPASAIGEAKKKYKTGSRSDPDLHMKIYIERKSLEWQYDQDPTDADGILFGQGNYVYALLFPYLFEVQQSTGGGGTPVPPITPPVAVINVYPIYITSSDFGSDGVSYDNANIVGDNLIIFPNELSQGWLGAGPTSFSYSATGLIINIPGFDANTQDWHITIQKFYN